MVFRDMIPGNWGQSGITGADRVFLQKVGHFKSVSIRIINNIENFGGKRNG
jgi:hypothetical protein